MPIEIIFFDSSWQWGRSRASISDFAGTVGQTHFSDFQMASLNGLLLLWPFFFNLFPDLRSRWSASALIADERAGGLVAQGRQVDSGHWPQPETSTCPGNPRYLCLYEVDRNSKWPITLDVAEWRGWWSTSSAYALSSLRFFRPNFHSGDKWRLLGRGTNLVNFHLVIISACCLTLPKLLNLHFWPALPILNCH